LDVTIIQNSASACRRFRALWFPTLEEASVFFSIDELQELGVTLSVTDVAKRLKIPMSTASRVIWALVQMKLLHLDSAAGDRRKKIVRVDVKRASGILTKQGLAANG